MKILLPENQICATDATLNLLWRVNVEVTRLAVDHGKSGFLDHFVFNLLLSSYDFKMLSYVNLYMEMSHVCTFRFVQPCSATY